MREREVDKRSGGWIRCRELFSSVWFGLVRIDCMM